MREFYIIKSVYCKPSHTPVSLLAWNFTYISLLACKCFTSVYLLALTFSLLPLCWHGNVYFYLFAGIDMFSYTRTGTSLLAWKSFTSISLLTCKYSYVSLLFICWHGNFSLIILCWHGPLDMITSTSLLAWKHFTSISLLAWT